LLHVHHKQIKGRNFKAEQQKLELGPHINQRMINTVKYVTFPVLIFALMGVIFVVAGVSSGLYVANRTVLAGGFLLSVSIAAYYGNTLRDYPGAETKPTKSPRDKPQLVLFLVFIALSIFFAILLLQTLA